MNWDDPADRVRLIDEVGINEYERRFHAHRNASIVATVNGHQIRPVTSGRFGRLFMVGDTGRAFQTQAEAERFANDTPRSQ